MGRMADDKSTSFEGSLERLEQIVQSLERDEPDLEKAIELFKDGRKLVAACEGMLKTAQEQLDTVNAPARPVEAALDDDEVEL